MEDSPEKTKKRSNIARNNTWTVWEVRSVKRIGQEKEKHEKETL